MLIAWLYLFLTEVFGDREKQFLGGRIFWLHSDSRLRHCLELVLNRQHERLQKRLSRLQISSTGAGDLPTLNQGGGVILYKRPSQKINRQGKMSRKAERLTRKSAKLLEMMKPGNETSEDLPQLHQELGGKWIKESDNDITSLPPAYDEIFPRHPPAYEDIQGTRRDNLYPILT